MLSLCASVNLADALIELRYLADCRGGLKGMARALFSRQLTVRNRDGHHTPYRSTNRNIRILNLVIISTLVLDQVLWIYGTQHYFRVARPMLLLTNVRVFHRISKLIMMTCLKVGT